MKSRIKEFFQDETGVLSATRLAFLTWSLGVFIIWTIICLIKKDLVSIPWPVVNMTLGFIASKAAGAWIDYNSKTNEVVVNNNNNNNNNIPEGFQSAPQPPL